jgi:hypothetical protein
MFQCYLCMELIRTARDLKSHFNNLHERREGFSERSFPCPECARLGQINCATIKGRKAWKEHIDQYHDGGVTKQSAVWFRVPEHRCLVCLKGNNTLDSLDHHLKLAHTELFANPFQCPACVRQGKQDLENFENQAACASHAYADHRGLVLSPNSGVNVLDGSPELKIPRCKEATCANLAWPESQLSSISTTTEGGVILPAFPKEAQAVIPRTKEPNDLQPTRNIEGSYKRTRDSLKRGQRASKNTKRYRVSAPAMPIDPALLDQSLE